MELRVTQTDRRDDVDRSGYNWSHIRPAPGIQYRSGSSGQAWQGSGPRTRVGSQSEHEHDSAGSCRSSHGSVLGHPAEAQLPTEPR